MGCIKFILGFSVTYVILQIFGKYANEVRIDHLSAASERALASIVAST
jgi:hypothetical protein